MKQEVNIDVDFFDCIKRNIDPDNNPNLKNRKKEWPNNIPIDFPETNNISNDINCPANEILVWKNNPLHYTYLCSIDEDARDEIAKDLLNFFMKCNWNKIIYSDNKIMEDWNQLKKSESVMGKEKDGIFLNNFGTVGNHIYKHFFPNILKVSSNGKMSVYDSLTNKEALWKIIRNRIGNTLLYNTKNRKHRQWPMNQTKNMIIQGSKCSGYASVGSIFKPNVAKTIYDYWVKDGYNVYDYSCGFGGRLLGLMATGKKVKYYGAEPNAETYSGLIKMSKYFNFNVNIRKMGSEDLIFKDKMDFVFSSPPYFNYEIYSNEKSQCYNRYPEYDEWLEKYWRKTVKNIKKMLKPNGIFAVNIGGNSNKEMIRIADDFKRIIKEEKFKSKEEWWMRTSRSHLTNKKRSGILFKEEGIYFYEF